VLIVSRVPRIHCFSPKAPLFGLYVDVLRVIKCVNFGFIISAIPFVSELFFLPQRSMYA